MIKIKDVTKKYDDRVILEHTDYTLPQRGIVCLMGASGGGKTTLLNLLAGFDSKYDGEITIGGTSITKMDTETLCRYRKDNIGFVFQNYHLLSGYTVLENVLLPCELTDEKPEESLRKAKDLLHRLNMEDKENQNIENLSGGEKQRVAIARALINNPQIIFADEPTGALDRNTSTEIMTLLKEISQDRLVIVITHDPKICEFADEVIHIKDKKIISEEETNRVTESEKPLITSKSIKPSWLHSASKNFKVHMKRYISVSLAISIGVLAFLFSLSFGNVMEKSIEEFKEKNTAFNNGYIKGKDDGTILEFLNKDERIENVYYQYKLNNVTLSFEGKVETMAEKFPMPKATQELSYGVMPRMGMDEIAITPSTAKKFAKDINTLIGKQLELGIDGQSHTLTISGIYNAGYDDFFISSDIERQLYRSMSEQDNYSISYDVKQFSDIVAVSNTMKLREINSENASKEVYALQDTFNNLTRLFFIISILILGIGLFICVVLLVKLQNTRYGEVGLLSALGFSKNSITSMILGENFILSLLATGINFVLLLSSFLLSKAFNFPLIITGIQIILSMVATFVVVMIVSGLASYKLIRTEPAEALRK